MPSRPRLKVGADPRGHIKGDFRVLESSLWILVDQYLIGQVINVAGPLVDTSGGILWKGGRKIDKYREDD